MDYEVIKISELEEMQDAENAWFLASESSNPMVSKRIKGSNIVPPVNVPSTFFVDRTYKGGDSNGSVTKPFVNLQDAINASPTSGAYQRIICAPRQSYGDITIDRLIIIQTLGSSESFGLSKIGNVTMTSTSFIMDMEIGGKVTVSGTTILMIDRCRCLDNIQLTGGNEVRIHDSAFPVLNKGILVEPTAPTVKSYIEASNVEGISIKADNTRVYADKCAFRSNTTFDSDYSGLVLTNAPMSFFRSCSFGLYNIDNESQQAEVRVKIEPKVEAGVISVIHFVDCQVTEDIIKNPHCKINDSYIRYTPQNYTTSGNKITDHIEGLDKAFVSPDFVKYTSREVNIDEFTSEVHPFLANVEIIKIGKSITLKYEFHFDSGITSLNVSWNIPVEFKRQIEYTWGGTGVCIDDPGRGTLKEKILQPIFVKYSEGRDISYFSFNVKSEPDYTAKSYITIHAILKD